MSFTYRWNFNSLEVTYSSASLDNVVSNVHWRYRAETEATSSLGVSGSFMSSEGGFEDLSPATSADFTAYASLTEALVTGWVTASMGDARVTEIQTSVSSSLAAQLSPSAGTKLKPW